MQFDMVKYAKKKIDKVFYISKMSKINNLTIIISMVLALFFGCLSTSLVAAPILNIDITEGIVKTRPVVLFPFEEQALNNRWKRNFPKDAIVPVVMQDLYNSGEFRFAISEEMNLYLKKEQKKYLDYWRELGYDYAITGKIIQQDSDMYRVEIEIIDIYKTGLAVKKLQETIGSEYDPKDAKAIILQKSYYNIRGGQFRDLSHYISDAIYESITGTKGIFTTKIAYVKKMDPMLHGGEFRRYSLMVADYDGYAPKEIVQSYAPLMSPTWSPDGKSLAYVSFENKKSEIFHIDVESGKRVVLTSFEGINSAPAWSPDGKALAVVLSKDGNPNLYLLEVASGALQQLTQSYTIDTEPCWGADGKSIIFTSNRGGKPQIYSLTLEDRKIVRITFEGDYNAKASYTPDGKSIIMMHKAAGSGSFNLAVQNLATGEFTVLTNGDLDNFPSLSPNGKMIIYGKNSGKCYSFNFVTLNGVFNLRLPYDLGCVQSPAWSPYLS